ncbi:MAG: beta/gamma crystallin family protein [Chloracidobacterium sp.]|nr:beta/gamma crystallin family protein [Chloracidobacterium sp.]
MKINKLIKTASAAVAFSFTVLLLAESTDAQGRYVGQYSRNDVDGIIRRLEDSGDEFRRDFIEAVNQSNLSGSQKSRYRDQVNDFENQTDRLRSNFDRNDSWWESRSEVQRVIANAAPLNVTMNAVNFRRNLERQWNRLRDDVNRLADTYDLPGIAGGGWTGGGNWPGGGGGAGITVFEDRNFRGDTATYQNSISNLPSRFNNRISSLRVSPGEQWQICDQSNYRGQCVNVSGEESDLRRNDWDNRISSMRRVSGGGYPGGGWGGPAINPPNWAVGRFYGTAPNGMQVTLTISGNGSVTAIVNGQMSYGTFTRGNNLYINGATSRVTRQGNGIRTVRNDNRERIDYARIGEGGAGGGWNPGNQVAPPSWARGTFFGIAPNGARITLTIAATGAVTANINGQYNYGSFTAGNMLYMGGAYARVTSISRGIRTVRTDNGETINYRRQ